MNNAIVNFPSPQNEPVLEYKKGSRERINLDAELQRQMKTTVEIPLIIGGKEIRTGQTGTVRMPHNHGHVLATYHKATEKEVKMAVDAAVAAHEKWAAFSWTERAAITLKAAELIATKFRALMNAATMLGQSKNIYQAEIDAVCETIDFLRFNAHFANRVYELQPKSSPNQLNKVDFRPLEGFVFTVSPFNFTSIAANLNMAPVMMGNTTVWKPATTALLSNYYMMKIFQEAGVPDGVINFVPGSGAVIGKTVLESPHLAGIHFTGSNETFNHLWKEVAGNLPRYISYPRLIGETGGKNFVIVHPTAVPKEVAVNVFRGAYEFQGQKCSAASRLYAPKSLWGEIRKELEALAKDAKMGDVTDPYNFINAVIDEASFDNIASYIEHAKASNDTEIIIGGKYDKSKGYFVEPTVLLTTNPKYKSMGEEIFGPVLTVLVYEDDKLDETLDLISTTSPYALTGAVFSKDRYAASYISEKLKYCAGNFYINDKPTGAVVGQQPFGGSRASGTNDKAGGEFNLFRWVSPRSIKETFVPATEYRYPYMME
jgi:1-pyrroline-5-carboxylate dehydrogenase